MKSLLSFYRRHRKTFEAAILASLAGFLVYELILGKLFSSRALDPDWYRDIGIMMNGAQVLVEAHRYAPAYLSPPPNAILLSLISRLGAATAFRLHLVLDAAAFAVTLACWASILGLRQKPERLLAIGAAVAASLYYLGWELRMHNINLLTLGLTSLVVVTQRRAGISGLLYGLDIGLKPYGATLLLPWLLWKRQYRWCLASGAGLLAIGFVLPALWFGVDETIRLYREWLQVLETAEGGSRLTLPAAIATLTGAAIDAPAVRLATRAAEAAWLAMLAAFFSTRNRAAPAAGLPLAAEVAAMLIAPLPLGFQQPARAAVLLVPMLVVATAAIDESRPLRTRYSLFLIMLFVGLMPWLVPFGPVQLILMPWFCIASLLGLFIAAGRVDSTVGVSRAAQG